MTSRALRATGATVVSLGLIIGLGACSSDSVKDNFCSEADTLKNLEFPEEPGELDKLVKKIDGIEAPDEIKDDWELLRSGIRDVAEITKLSEAGEEADQERIMEIAQNLDTEKLDEASDNVDEYIEKEC